MIIGSDNGLSPGWCEVLDYCQLNPEEQIAVIFESKYDNFLQEKVIWKYCIKNGSILSRPQWVKTKCTLQTLKQLHRWSK